MSIKVGDEVMIFINYEDLKLLKLQDIQVFSAIAYDAVVNYVICEVLNINTYLNEVTLRVISDVLPNKDYDFFNKYNRVYGINYNTTSNTIKMSLDKIYLSSVANKYLADCEEKTKSLESTISKKYDEVEKILNDINALCKSNNLTEPKNISEQLKDRSLDLVENLGWSTSSFFC